MTLLVATFFYLIFLCPESREPSTRLSISPSVDNATFKTSPLLVIRRYLHRFITALMIPLAMFAPQSIPGKPNKKNYNLTLMGLGLFLYIVSTVRYSRPLRVHF
jgi:hypothetical protein